MNRNLRQPDLLQGQRHDDANAVSSASESMQCVALAEQNSSFCRAHRYNHERMMDEDAFFRSGKVEVEEDEL